MRISCFLSCYFPLTLLVPTFITLDMHKLRKRNFGYSNFDNDQTGGIIKFETWPQNREGEGQKLENCLKSVQKYSCLNFLVLLRFKGGEFGQKR